MASADAISDCETDSSELIISEVQRFPTLYDQRLSAYKDQALKDHIWEKIGRELKASGMFINTYSNLPGSPVGTTRFSSAGT